MELEFDKYCVVDGSPTTVLPSPHRRSKAKAAYRKSNGKLKCGNDITEISFNRYLSASCRDVGSKRADHELPKRGSVYQSSKEVNLRSKTDIGPVRREKVELSRESASPLFPFGIIDSLCGSDEDRSFAEPNRCSVMSTSEQSTSSFCKNQIENYPAVNLQKSRPARLASPHSPARSESHGSKTNSPKAVFNLSARKKFDPFVNSRSHRSPLSREISESIGLSCNENNFKPQVKDFSDNLNSLALSSPAHLHGILIKSENKNGFPFFEFSVKSPEDVYYVAKTWKVDNALTWVHTFHSLHHKRRKSSNVSGWGFKDNSRESTMVGQMVMSCYLCTELKCAGAFNDSMVTEYVLYEIAQSRRSASSHEDNSSCSPDITKAPLVSDCKQNEISAKKMNKGRIFNNHSQPLAVAELHPELETAAVIMQVPFEKRESLKFKSGDSEMDNNNNNPVPNLLDLCRLEEVKEGICDNSSRGKMHVVIPDGNHSLPSSESRGPSPLLDRWRLGGGCDCGGWDMACPLDVFVNPNFRIAEGQHLMMDDRHPVQLFVQGRKDNDIAAFSMRAIEDGKYTVDFHAQLSCLQAFSICVAILHAASASTAVGHERSKQSGDSLRVFAEEEIKNLMMDAISEGEEKFKANNKNKEKVLPLPPSFVINPPFSPIARV